MLWSRLLPGRQPVAPFINRRSELDALRAHLKTGHAELVAGAGRGARTELGVDLRAPLRRRD